MAAMSTTGISPARQNYSYIKDDTIAGAKYAVRIINDGAFSPSDTFQTRYKLVVDGCDRWSNLRHPNIVPFLGMNTSNNKSIPSLLMEYFPTNLNQFLKSPQAKPIPLSLKISILQDVACGLTYLHDQSPPIIHGRLSAENILLDSGAVAKISVDLGVMILPRPLEMTSPYMPPEVTSPQSPQTKAIDIYSVGILTIFTLTHNLLPGALQETYTAESKTGYNTDHSKVDHRGHIMQKINSQFSKEHPIIQLIKKCLSDSPDSRPTTGEVSSLLKQAGIMIPDSFENKTKIDVIQEMTILAQAHVEMRVDFEKHERELRDQITGLLKGMEKQRRLLPHEYEDENEEMVTENEIFYIANFVEGIPAKVLGLELGLNQHHVEIIMCDFHDENARRLEVLSQWVKNDDPEKCTWSTLIKSLSSIGQKRIAQLLSKDKGLPYCEYITTEIESTLTETEHNETKKELPKVDVDTRPLESQLQRAKKYQERSEARLAECRNELDEMNKKYDELIKEMTDKEKELTHLKREVKAEERIREETVKENMELKLKVEQLKRK